MRKLQLDISELRVEAFETAPAVDKRRGTVQGRGIPFAPFGPPPSITSEAFCYDGTCWVHTADSCWLSLCIPCEG
jgi:hypothetical protein